MSTDSNTSDNVVRIPGAARKMRTERADQVMTPPLKAVLEPYANAWIERQKQNLKELREMDTEALKALYLACLRATKNNCWFATYGAARELLPRVRRVLIERVCA